MTFDVSNFRELITDKCETNNVQINCLSFVSSGPDLNNFI